MNDRPPPGEPPDPGIVKSFIDECIAGIWDRDGVISPATGALLYPAVATSTLWPTDGQWALESTGLKLAEAVYTVLRGSTANADGSFTTATGAAYYLGSRSGFAVLVAV